MKRSDLQNVYSPVPQGFHNALHNAAHSVEEKTDMKKNTSLVAICLLALLLTCGTALAVVKGYSVRQYAAGGNPSPAFERHITQLDQVFENEYVSFTLTDAIFDGNAISLAMNIKPIDESKPVYIFPQLTATCNGRSLDLDVVGMRGDFMSGFMIPKQTDDDTLGGQYGVDVELFEDEADADVTWHFTLQVLAANWPIKNDDATLRGEGLDLSHEDFFQLFADSYARGEILTTWGESLSEYAAMLPTPSGMSDEAFRAMKLGDQLAQSGAFTLIQTFVCYFDTALPSEQW